MVDRGVALFGCKRLFHNCVMFVARDCFSEISGFCRICGTGVRPKRLTPAILSSVVKSYRKDIDVAYV